MNEIDEEHFVAAVAAGRVLERAGERVDAELIRTFCVRRFDEVDPRGIRLRGLRVTGELDLTAVEVPFALSFEQCVFDAPPILHGARVRELTFDGCTLPGLLANGMEVLGDLELSRSRIEGCVPTSASTSRRAAIWLCESKIGGRLRCLDTVIEPHGERAIQADRMHVGGTIRLLNTFHAAGELRLVGLQVSGSIDMTGARVEAAGHAVDLADATIAGNVYVAPYDAPDGTQRRPQIHGRINLSSTRIDGRLLLKDADLVRPERDDSRYHSARFEGKALVGPRLFVGAEFAIEGSTMITGGMDLSLAELGGMAIDARTVIDAAGHTALNLINAEIRSDLVAVGAGVQVKGTVLLVGAHIRGRLDLHDVVLTDPRGHSVLKVDGATIDGDVGLKRLRATGGQLKFWRTTIGGGLDATGAVVENPNGGTVRLHSCQVGGSVRLVYGFRSTGCVVLSRSMVGGSLDLSGGHFHCPGPGRYNPEGAAIRAVSADFRGGMDLGWASIAPAINVTDTTTSVLQDDPSRWPERIYIAGFTYGRFDAPRGDAVRRGIWDWRARRDWVRQQPEYDAGPYEQAARVFRQHGYVQDAEQLLISQRTDARNAERLLVASRTDARGRLGRLRARANSVLDWIFDWTVGYGYRPGRVLWLLVGLLAVVSITLAVPGVQQTMRASDEGVVFTVNGPVDTSEPALDPCGGGRVRCFNPVLYAVDTVIPLIALDQRSTWYPERFVTGGRAVEWWLNIATVAGWLLSSIFLLSFARLARIV